MIGSMIANSDEEESETEHVLSSEESEAEALLNEIANMGKEKRIPSPKLKAQNTSKYIEVTIFHFYKFLNSITELG